VRLTNGAGVLRYACSSYSFGVRSRRGRLTTFYLSIFTLVRANALMVSN
jgi:hypothetical protein